MMSTFLFHVVLAVLVLVNNAILLTGDCCYGKDICFAQETLDLCLTADASCKWSCVANDNYIDLEIDDDYYYQHDRNWLHKLFNNDMDIDKNQSLSGLYTFDRNGNEAIIRLNKTYLKSLNKSDTLNITQRRRLKRINLNPKLIQKPPFTSVGQLWFKILLGPPLPRAKAFLLWKNTLKKFKEANSGVIPTAKLLSVWSQKNKDPKQGIVPLDEYRAKGAIDDQIDKNAHGVATIIKAEEIPESGGKWRYVALTVAHNIIKFGKHWDFAFYHPPDPQKGRGSPILPPDKWDKVWIPFETKYKVERNMQYDWAIVSWIMDKKVDKKLITVMQNENFDAIQEEKKEMVEVCSITYDSHYHPNQQIILGQTWKQAEDGRFWVHPLIKEFGKGPGLSGTALAAGALIPMHGHCIIHYIVGILTGKGRVFKKWTADTAHVLKQELKDALGNKKDDEVDDVIDKAVIGELWEWDDVAEDVFDQPQDSWFRDYFEEHHYGWFGLFQKAFFERFEVKAKRFDSNDIVIIKSILNEEIEPNMQRSSAYQQIYNEYDNEYDNEYEYESVPIVYPTNMSNTIIVYGLIILCMAIICCFVFCLIGGIVGYFGAKKISNLSNKSNDNSL